MSIRKKNQKTLKRYGISIKTEYEVPDDVFMVLELKKNSLNRIEGTVKYHATFSSV